MKYIHQISTFNNFVYKNKHMIKTYVHIHNIVKYLLMKSNVITISTSLFRLQTQKQLKDYHKSVSYFLKYDHF